MKKIKIKKNTKKIKELFDKLESNGYKDFLLMNFSEEAIIDNLLCFLENDCFLEKVDKFIKEKICIYKCSTLEELIIEFESISGIILNQEKIKKLNFYEIENQYEKFFLEIF